MKNVHLEEKPPPVPRRTMNQIHGGHQYSSGGYSSLYGNPYQNMMYSTPGFGYGPRSGYGNDSFIPAFEDVTAGAFHSVGSVIQAFSSVSMMLESTLFATQNSVRALASVADQFRYVRLQLLTTAASFLRTFRYYIRKFMVLFRIKKQSQMESQALEDAFQNSSSSSGDSKNLVIVLFYAVVFATPVIMWQLLRRIVSDNHGKSSKWQKGLDDHFLAEVKYSFTAENQDELSIDSGDIVRVAPKHLQPDIRGWILASNGDKSGIVPTNYIQILGKNRSGESNKITLPVTHAISAAPAARESELLSTENLNNLPVEKTNP